MKFDWSKYTAEEVRTGTDRYGSRLFSLFIQDYIKVFGTDICPSCNDFPMKYQKFLNKFKMSKEESKFKLKAMYEGLPLEFGSPVYVTNANITDQNAMALLKNHPRGKELFEVLPSNIDELMNSSINTGNNQNTAATATQTAVKIFDKDLSVEEVKSLFEQTGVKSNATSIKGLQKAFDGLSDEAKEKIKILLPAE